jgi:hypothetical protein
MKEQPDDVPTTDAEELVQIRERIRLLDKRVGVLEDRVLQGAKKKGRRKKANEPT